MEFIRAGNNFTGSHFHVLGWCITRSCLAGGIYVTVTGAG